MHKDIDLFIMSLLFHVLKVLFCRSANPEYFMTDPALSELCHYKKVK